MTVVLGLTGGIGSGKSTAAEVFKKLDVPVIESDRISREAVEKGKPAWREIIAHFGRGILCADGSLDRRKLGEIVFADLREKKVLEKIVHPRVSREIKRRLAAMKKKGRPLVVVDIPLLFEAGLEGLVDKTVVVWAPKQVCRTRVQNRDRLSAKETEARIRAQLPLAKKAQRADYVLDNSKRKSNLVRQVKNLAGVLTFKQE